MPLTFSPRFRTFRAPGFTSAGVQEQKDQNEVAPPPAPASLLSNFQAVPEHGGGSDGTGGSSTNTHTHNPADLFGGFKAAFAGIANPTPGTKHAADIDHDAVNEAHFKGTAALSDKANADAASPEAPGPQGPAPGGLGPVGNRGPGQPPGPDTGGFAEGMDGPDPNSSDAPGPDAPGPDSPNGGMGGHGAGGDGSGGGSGSGGDSSGGGGSGDGGGCCFTGETEVVMGDGSIRGIDEIKIGDKVQGDSRVNEVVGINTPLLENRPLIGFNDSALFTTWDHPFWDEANEVWRCVKPESRDPAIDLDVEPLRVGDSIKTAGGPMAVLEIKYLDAAPHVQLYDLVLDGDHTYSANGFTVHNCKLHGGLVSKSEMGPDIDGPGGDDGTVSMKSGEYVLQEQAAAYYGPEVMEALNSGTIPVEVMQELVMMGGEQMGQQPYMPPGQEVMDPNMRPGEPNRHPVDGSPMPAYGMGGEQPMNPNANADYGAPGGMRSDYDGGGSGQNNSHARSDTPLGASTLNNGHQGGEVTGYGGMAMGSGYRGMGQNSGAGGPRGPRSAMADPRYRR